MNPFFSIDGIRSHLTFSTEESSKRIFITKRENFDIKLFFSLKKQKFV